MNLSVWINASFEGHYPIGVAAVVVAESPERASILLNEELVKEGLKPTATADQFSLVIPSEEAALIICNGNY